MSTSVQALPAAFLKSRPPVEIPAWWRVVLTDRALLGISVSLFFSGVGAWRALVLHQAVGDALSRTYSAMSVLYSHQPHLAAIGFDWPPLPALAQLPLLRIAPGLAFFGLSGDLVSALCAGLVAVIVLGLLRRLHIGRWGSLLLVVALFANPLMATHAANGMSEMPFLLFLVLGCDRFLAWAETGRWQQLAYAGVACAGSFLCRYDGAVVTVLMAAAVLPVMHFSKRDFFPPKVEANLLAFLAPVAYTGMLWLFFNKLIMGQALYFMHSRYAIFQTQPQPEVQQLQQSLVATLRYFLVTVGSFSPLFAAGCVVAVAIAIWRRDAILAGLLAILLAAPLFQLDYYRSGITFADPRYWISVIPSGLILGAYLLHQWDVHNAVPTALLLSTLLIGSAVTARTLVAVNEPSTGPIDVAALFAGVLPLSMDKSSQMADELRAAQYLDQHAVGRTILADSAGSDVALLSGHLERFFLVSDDDWRKVALQPVGHAKYIVALRAHPGYHDFLDIYPTLYEQGTPFTSLEADFGWVRIYRVNG